MRSPVGIAILGCSFIAVSAILLGVSSWYWAGEPVDEGVKAIQMLVELAAGFAAGTIGIGLIVHSNVSRWLAVLALIVVILFGVAALAWDALVQRDTWLLLDIFLLAALAPAVLYLFLPAVRRAFSRGHGRPAMRH